MAGIARVTWRDHAACRGLDPTIWFPGDAISKHYPRQLYSQQVETAQTICATCPVTADCLDWADRTGQDHGIWGGLTPAERKNRRRRLAYQNRHAS